MKMIAIFLLLLVVAGVSGMLVFLNQGKVTLLLTPSFRGLYYALPEMSIGLLVVLSFFVGLFVGYLSALVTRFLNKP
ncbi:MAG: hypothetical protein N3D14_01945 [Aquificaceae bacterium]|nr:hypothetical protein [Aquificaceae bacterium]